MLNASVFVKGNTVGNARKENSVEYAYGVNNIKVGVKFQRRKQYFSGFQVEISSMVSKCGLNLITGKGYAYVYRVKVTVL